MDALDIVSLMLATGGVVFFFAGALGLLRFPDVYSRLHALTKADNLGLGLITIAVVLQLNSPTQWLKLGLIWLLVMLSGAVTCHLIARRARRVENRHRNRSACHDADS
ncbi:multisubunit sodium/proton antiporter, MrpG subunit [Modicisalibacter ilicicola DSM 19980]|uniref:Multisubunit sodium/proton antiporter, MrpG subunit n=1 Tax=Modicisalibacter ilicicola DSM 19980 TaxID=1121942 RepID=A0A1M4ZQR3_9GAMM|nr:monovalent cation/H(+) antiporter subunit G [Halomonas ilicicola]SHF20137.1 multisubunit sodium/proton antiporter, MrpG subunit [Halomonas ilicicola DSM 19980]